jgi:hypothetical protein
MMITMQIFSLIYRFSVIQQRYPSLRQVLSSRSAFAVAWFCSGQPNCVRL